MRHLLEDLNKPQREAVEAADGPILMLAGAGSGKTKTLTHRIAYLISARGVAPSNILAVTFTNKAAGEMRSRINALLGRPSEDRHYLPFLGTFHSIAVRILRREAAHLGYPSGFVIYDEADAVAVVKRVMRSLSIDEKVFNPQAIRNQISSAKNELIGPGNYTKLAVGRLQETAARVYELYQSELKKAGVMDFDDLIMQLVRLLMENPEILERYQRTFTHILVDEYQDTNHAQYQLIKLLAAHQNICVVGDDWQSIYSWRGANYENILNFERDYPAAKVIKLEQNYRSTQSILDAAHSVIAKNISRSDKKLWTDKSSGPKVVIEQVRSELDEGQFIIRTIDQSMSQKRTMRYHDFAVLYRTNAQSRQLEEAFLRYNIPYQIVGGLRFYERREIKDIIAYLRLLVAPNDMVSFNRAINLPPRGLGDKSLAIFREYHSRGEATIIETASEAEQIDGLSARARRSFVDFAAILKDITNRLNELNVGEVVELLLKRVGYLDWLNDGSLTAEDRAENVAEFIGVAKNFNVDSLEDFLSEIALISDLDTIREGGEAVTLMTLHAAKGLEFDTVFMTGMEEGIFPHSRTFFEPTQLEEERRLCYVGMTRARRQLFMINASSRLLYGSTQHNPPSRFLMDIPSEVCESDRGLSGQTAVNETVEKSPRPLLEVEIGDWVQHDSFGAGQITDKENSEVVVNFEQHGIKKLSLAFAPLKKR